MLERFHTDARRVVVLAREKATERGEDRIRPAHLLYGLVTYDGVASRMLAGLGVTAAAVEREMGAARTPVRPDDGEALKAIGIDLDEIRRKVEEGFGEGALDRVPLTRSGPFGWSGPRISLTGESKLTFEFAVREARALHHDYLGTEHLLLGLLRTGQRNRFGDFTPATLRALGIDPDEARERVLAELTRDGQR
jgi:Clp amino terminal domain, pathogenicity island component